MTKRFGPVTAVDDMSLRIERGAFYSLLGPSGCGKTTTLRMIAGFEQPTSGEICLDGQPVAGVPPYRRNVNTVFQHYALFPHMTVAQNVGYGLRQTGIKRKEEERRVDEALMLVRLFHYGHRRTWELSGGQQQRVALARALINHPPCSCSTSRWARSTGSCVTRCRSSSSSSSSRSASRSCTSPTTRKRRSP